MQSLNLQAKLSFFCFKSTCCTKGGSIKFNHLRISRRTYMQVFAHEVSQHLPFWVIRSHERGMAIFELEAAQK